MFPNLQYSAVHSLIESDTILPITKSLKCHRFSLEAFASNPLCQLRVTWKVGMAVFEAYGSAGKVGIQLSEDLLKGELPMLYIV